MSGILKGYDQLLNLVLEDAVETMRDVDDHTVLSRNTRALTSKTSGEKNANRVVCRGTAVMVVSLQQGIQEVSNPFAEQ